MCGARSTASGLASDSTRWTCVWIFLSACTAAGAGPAVGTMKPGSSRVRPNAAAQPDERVNCKAAAARRHQLTAARSRGARPESQGTGVSYAQLGSANSPHGPASIVSIFATVGSPTPVSFRKNIVTICDRQKSRIEIPNWRELSLPCGRCSLRMARSCELSGAPPAGLMAIGK